ncbi:MAG: hypothetical protein IKK94_00945 [Clostridia bacterium]|nr:hypothetical protein [Clostridia bacterium]
MKKVLIFFVLILSVSLLFGCGKEESENKTDLDVYNVSNLEAYSIVRSENASDTVNKATNDLCAAFLKKTGKSVKTAKDSADEKRFEIIIGETSRKIEDTAIDKLGFSQFLIKKIGDKIVIAGGTDNAVASGVDFLIEHFIVESSLYAPIDGYLGENKKLINSLSIEGTSIENYTVVADLFDISIAESFALELETALGFALPVASLEEYELSKGRYILLSDTNSDFSKYSVKIENGNITFFANYDSLEDCKDYFFSDILNFDTEKGTAMGDRDVKITNEMSKDFTIESTPIYTKEKLYEVLETVYNDDDSLIIAQHSFPRIGDSIRFERAQYKEGCGVDVPMLGYDVAEVLMGEPTLNAQICEAYDMVQFAREGGILTFSLHLDNPAEEGYAYRGELGHEDKWDELFTEGTELNLIFMEQLEKIGDFLEIVHNNGVPVIFRPLHEMNGNWFWFCIRNGEDDYLLPKEYAKKFWVFLYDYFVTERGIDSMLWEYSPNVMENADMVMYCYPGDEYCDLVSCDWYTEEYSGHDILSVSAEALQKTGKIFSVSEFGPNGDIMTDLSVSDEYKFSCITLDEIITEVRDGNIKMAYWLIWSSWGDVKISMHNMGGADMFYRNGVYLTLEDTYKLLYE